MFDFDGVLTDNRVLVLQDGTEGVLCHRADGLGFDLFRAAGIPVLILSTEANPVVRARARKLRVPVLSGVAHKDEVLRRYCARKGWALTDVMFVGNDLNDRAAMQLVGYPVCPRDAHPAIRRLAWRVLRAVGGAGVAREVAERLLRLA